MEKVAFISGGVFIYWSSIILTLAVVTAMLLFISVYMGKSKNAMGAFAAVPVAAMLSIVLGRLIHWYCRTDAYESLEAAMGNFTAGGYALMGAFAACILTACLLRLVRIVKNLPQMFDSMAIAGGAGIAVGRLASLFNSSDRGIVLPDYVGLPFAYPVTNAVSGVVENRLATFMLQSLFAGALVLVLLLHMLVCRIRKKKIRDGDIALLFLSAYGGSQVLLDSTRYDSLFMRSNGFISIVQILGAVSLALVMIVFSVRMVRRHGLKVYHFIPWIAFAGALGVAGYMEYYVQRHGDQAMYAYSIMAAAIGLMILLTLAVRGLWRMKPRSAGRKKNVRRERAAAESQPQQPVVPAAEEEDNWEAWLTQVEQPAPEETAAAEEVPDDRTWMTAEPEPAWEDDWLHDELEKARSRRTREEVWETAERENTPSWELDLQDTDIFFKE